MSTQNMPEEPDYSHKPPQLNTIQDLVKFIRGIPARFWCVDKLQNPPTAGDKTVRRCVIGHIGAAYGDRGSQSLAWGARMELLPNSPKMSAMQLRNELVFANNGEREITPTFDTRKARSPGIKKRLFEFLKTLR